MTELKEVQYKKKFKRKPLNASRTRVKFCLRKVSAKRSKPRQRGISSLKRELDAIFSKFIRERDHHTCYTCGLVMEPKKSQNGHFVPRQYLALRWDETNCHCQCYADNVLFNGQPSAYAARLKKDYGEDIVDKLESRRKEICKLTPEWYREMIKTYTDRLSQLKEV